MEHEGIKWISRIFIAVTLLIIGGCASTATLYPSNDIASRMGVLKATYMNYGTGGGKITIIMPDGEKLEGEYSQGCSMLEHSDIGSEIIQT